MKRLSESTIQYMDSVWRFSTASEVDDIMMFWDEGEVEMVAKRLVDAGAVEANCKQAKEMIRVTKSITQDQEDTIFDKVLSKYTVVECSNCNFYHFIGPSCNAKDWLAPNACHGCAVVGHTKIS